MPVHPLNPTQQQAADHKDGPLLIIAGAGTGKTKTLTHRIVNLMKKGVPGDNILAITFTNKAAKEMKERVLQLIDEDADLNRPINARSTGATVPFMSTFHSLGVYLLREFHETMRLKRHFTIFDRDDSVRTVKKIVESLGYDPKQHDPRSIMNAISSTKGDGKTYEHLLRQTGNPWKSFAGEVMKRYDEALHQEGALDFDDLLYKTVVLLRENADIREQLHSRWKYIHIDEYQDTNQIQFEMAQLLTGPENNICVVGDTDQCVAPGTLVTLADGTSKKVEHLTAENSIKTNFGNGNFGTSKITRINKKKYSKDLVEIKTENGRTITSSQEHMHFAQYLLGHTPQYYFTYLMYKKGYGFRTGVSQVYTNGQVKPVIGFVLRNNHEHADGIWILKTFKTPQEARVYEYTISLNYKIPTIPFVARKKIGARGYIHDQKVINELFTLFDTEKSGREVLKAHAQEFEVPHHIPQTSRSPRTNVTIVYCGDGRGKRSLHRIAIVDADPKKADILKKNGFTIRKAKAHSTSWRFESSYSNPQKVFRIARKIQSLIPGTRIIQKAQVLKKVGNKKINSSLRLLPAKTIHPGMVMCDESGNVDVIQSVRQIPNKKGYVYDIDVAHTHNFIANGIVTHNSIYSWRGALIENLLNFEKEFPNTTTITLEENYRSTQNILAAANAVIKLNRKRTDKNLFTKGEEGETLSVHIAYSGDDEARYIAETAGGLIGNRVNPAKIAVLYRVNFLSRVLEEQFLRAGVPYQVLGTRFFERMEVKDVLSYLKASLNPAAQSDVARASATPPRGIGKVTLAKMLLNEDLSLTPALQKKVGDFRKLLSAIATFAKRERPSHTIAYIIKESGLEKMFKGDGADGQERLENIRELVALATKYDEMPPEEGIAKLLDDAALSTDQDSLEKKESSVKLMTIHAAKGLEFDYVFIPALEQGLFPHEKMGEEKVDDEEERRLMYVALTRARKKLLLSYAMTRTVFGSQTVTVPSEFLNDIPEELLENSGGDDTGGSRKMDLIDF